MAIPQWVARQSLAQPNINPTAAIAGASQAFGNISDTLQKQEAVAKEAEFRRQQIAAQQRNQDLQEQKFLFDQGAGDRAVQANIAEENRLKQGRADQHKLFSGAVGSKTQELLSGFALNPDSRSALKSQGLSEEQISELVNKTKQKSPDLFLDHSKILSGVTDELLSQGVPREDIQPFLSDYMSKQGLNGANPETVKFAQDLALANVRSGGGGSGGGSKGSGSSDSNFINNLSTVSDEKSFSDRPEAWHEGWFGGSKVNREDVHNVAEYALATQGIRPAYVAQAIKARMHDGKTEFNLSKIAGDPENPDLQGILASAQLMQSQIEGSSGSGGVGGSRNTPAPGSIGSPEFALNLGMGVQPVSVADRRQALLGEARTSYPDLFKSVQSGAASTPAQTADTGKIFQAPAAQPDNVPRPAEKASQLIELAKSVSSGGDSRRDRRSSSPEQKELSSLLQIAEKEDKPLISDMRARQSRMSDEKLISANEKIQTSNASLKKQREEALRKIEKILESSSNKKLFQPQ